MTTIKKKDFVDSIAESLQHISYYHPLDFVKAMHAAYLREENPAAKDAIGQILINSKMAAVGKRPICQDTGIVNVFLKVGKNCQFDCSESLQELVDEGVRLAYGHPENPLRASVVKSPATNRLNTKDNSPAIVYTEIVEGNGIDISIAAKGGGSENKTKLAMLNPNDSIVDWVKKVVPTMGAGWCPPGIISLGVGGTADKAMVLAKEGLMAAVDMPEILARGPKDKVEELRVALYHAINDLGIGAQGLGGLTTVVDVKLAEYPTHAASLPVALIPNCAATRHTHFHLDGSGPAEFPRPDITQWPDISLAAGDKVKRVHLNNITKEEIATWQTGETLLLNGKILTGRDAAHKRIKGLLDAGEPLPAGVDFNGRFIYYVGPVDPVGTEVVGPAGPTTSTRMDKFTDMMLEEAGLFGMIGKSERGDETIESIKKNKAVYLMAVGGAAYLVSKAIKKSRVVAFADLGMEAIYEFEVEDMPVTVAVDARGEAIHKTGPTFWQEHIRQMKR
ncbi:fumarate hydratase [Desulfotalea psychrophila]|nr:fumarate hydratase [Desulfotalea psychrophila]